MSQRPTTLAIMQLTRPGDILQTFLSLQGLKKIRSDIRIIFIARSQFLKELEGIIPPSIDKIYHYTLPATKKLVRELAKEDIFVLANLSFSQESQYLAREIQAKQKLGLSRTSEDQIVIHDPLSRYLFTHVLAGNCNPFNLTDLFRSILGSSAPIDEDSLPLRKENSRVIVHPFASTQEKSWPLETWKEIIYRLAKDRPDATIVIMGSMNDAIFLNELLPMDLFAEFNDRIQVEVGTKTISELSVYFQNATLFIGNDSMGGHLAAYFKLQSLTLTWGQVRPHETTPYGNLNYNLIPLNQASMKPHSTYLPLVHNIIDQLLDFGIVDLDLIRLKGQSNLLSEFYLSVTSLGPEGMLRLTPINEVDQKQSQGIQQIYLNLNHIFWSFWLFDKHITLSNSGLSSDALIHFTNVKELLQVLYQLSDVGLTTSRNLKIDLKKNTSDSVISIHFNRVQDLLKQMEILKNAHPEMLPFISYFQYGIQETPSTDPMITACWLEEGFTSFCHAIKAYFELTNQLLKNTSSNWQSSNGH